MAAEVLFSSGRQRRIESANAVDERGSFIHVYCDQTELAAYDVEQITHVSLYGDHGAVIKVIRVGSETPARTRVLIVVDVEATEALVSLPTASSQVGDHTGFRLAVDRAPSAEVLQQRASHRLVEFVIAPALFVLLVFLVLLIGLW